MSVVTSIARRGFGLALGLLAAAAVWAQTATVGQPAPAFELVDAKGRVVKLSDFKGRHVVLEWTNPGCPFVLKHYGAQNMQGLQKEAKAKDVVWLSISSTAPGHADYLAPGALAAQYQVWGASPTALLLDDSGKVGRTYGARTTPHCFVIDSKGVLRYEGAIDDNKEGKMNYVVNAVKQIKANETVSPEKTQPYGCGVKY